MDSSANGPRSTTNDDDIDDRARGPANEGHSTGNGNGNGVASRGTGRVGGTIGARANKPSRAGSSRMGNVARNNTLHPGSKPRSPAKGPPTVDGKLPSVPKRFKSSFIFFSMQKHKEVREEIAKQADGVQHSNITKMVAQAWRGMKPEDRAVYEEMARVDKQRYEREKAAYPGSIGGPGSRKMRNPNAPKRPMSAYLSYANSRRGAVKAKNPDCTNGEISKILSNMWKEADAADKQRFRAEEASMWAEYKAKMVKWKKENDGRKKRNSQANKALRGMGNTPAVSAGIIDPMQSALQSGFTMAAATALAAQTQQQAQQQAHRQMTTLTAANELIAHGYGGPNTDEMMAASALSGVRGAPSTYPFGVASAPPAGTAPSTGSGSATPAPSTSTSTGARTAGAVPTASAATGGSLPTASDFQMHLHQGLLGAAAAVAGGGNLIDMSPFLQNVQGNAIASQLQQDAAGVPQQQQQQQRQQRQQQPQSQQQQSQQQPAGHGNASGAQLPIGMQQNAQMLEAIGALGFPYQGFQMQTQPMAVVSTAASAAATPQTSAAAMTAPQSFGHQLPRNTQLTGLNMNMYGMNSNAQSMQQQARVQAQHSMQGLGQSHLQPTPLRDNHPIRDMQQAMQHTLQHLQPQLFQPQQQSQQQQQQQEQQPQLLNQASLNQLASFAGTQVHRGPLSAQLDPNASTNVTNANTSNSQLTMGVGNNANASSYIHPNGHLGNDFNDQSGRM